MSKERDRAGVVLGASAAIASAIALARSARKVQAAPEETPTVVTLAPVIQELLEAIAGGAAASLEAIQRIETAIHGLQFPTVAGAIGVVPNADFFASGRMNVLALNQARQLPHMEIPDDFEVVLKGWPTNGGIIYVACTAPSAGNINAVWPLIANETIGYRIENLNTVYFTGTVVGDWICWTVEQRGKAR